MGILALDLRFALRTIRKAPAVTLLAVASLALAIAGNTTVFSFINGFLYRPLPYDDPERLVFVCERKTTHLGRLFHPRSPWPSCCSPAPALPSVVS